MYTKLVYKSQRLDKAYVSSSECLSEQGFVHAMKH